MMVGRAGRGKLQSLACAILHGGERHAGRNLGRAQGIDDLRAMAHARLPRFVLEYLEGGAEDEASLARDRTAYEQWRSVPRQLVDVSQRSMAATILGRPVPLPLVVKNPRRSGATKSTTLLKVGKPRPASRRAGPHGGVRDRWPAARHGPAQGAGPGR